MQLLYTDETNVDPAITDFFTYAGVAIPGDAAGPLSRRVDDLRKQYAYGPSDLLKFNTKERPNQVTQDAHRDLKRDVMDAAAQSGVKLFASFIMHRVATSPADARRNEINRICFHFNCYLNRVNDYGLVLIDTFQDNLLTRFLREKFSVGLVGLPYSATYRLDRVLGFHLSSIGSSNFCLVVDIVIGALRDGINAQNNPAQAQVAQALFRQLGPLAIRTPAGKVDEISLLFSPKTVRAPSYLKQYQAYTRTLPKTAWIANNSCKGGGVRVI